MTLLPKECPTCGQQVQTWDHVERCRKFKVTGNCPVLMTDRQYVVSATSEEEAKERARDQYGIGLIISKVEVHDGP